MSKLYVGVDWHKRQSTWTAINEQREQVYCRTWDCTPEAVHTALSSLPAPPSDVTLGVEPVCGWRWMTDICQERGVGTISIANPKKLREIANSAQKTDKNDARTIAELLRMDYLPTAYKAPEDINAVRILVRQRGFFVRLNTATKCRIHGVCTALGAHTTADKPLHQSGQTKLTQGSNQELCELFQLVDYMNTQRKSIEKRITETIESTAVYKTLQTMPGVGLVTGAAIYAEVGDFSRFASPEKLISYAGLYPKERSSGGQQHFMGMSKVGSRILRYSIIEAAMRIRDVESSHNLYSHYYAARYIRKKKPKQARVVLAHKMLTIMWHLVTKGTQYDDRAVKPAQREMIS